MSICCSGSGNQITEAEKHIQTEFGKKMAFSVKSCKTTQRNLIY